MIVEVIKESEEKYKELLNQALEEALKNAEEKWRKVEEEGREIVRKAEEEGKRTYRQLITQAELESKGTLLKKFDELIDEVLEEVLRDIEKLPEERYGKAIEKFINEAIGSLGSEEVIIQIGKKDKSRIMKVVKSFEKEGLKIDVDKSPLSEDYGFIMRTKDGKVSIDYTFKSLKERLKPIIKRKVVETYFKEVLE